MKCHVVNFDYSLARQFKDDHDYNNGCDDDDDDDDDVDDEDDCGHNGRQGAHNAVACIFSQWTEPAGKTLMFLTDH